MYLITVGFDFDSREESCVSLLNHMLVIPTV